MLTWVYVVFDMLREGSFLLDLIYINLETMSGYKGITQSSEDNVQTGRATIMELSLPLTPKGNTVQSLLIFFL